MLRLSGFLRQPGSLIWKTIAIANPAEVMLIEPLLDSRLIRRRP